MTRLTFVGDIALDKPLLKAAKERGKGTFDFSDVFHTEDVFAKSDLVIGNLETVFGGGRRFNKKPYHYNSPDSFCDAIKNAGIGLVSTATNHCIDEGVDGIKRTLSVLDQRGIEHTGTFSEETNDRFLIKTINGVRIAFLSLTYSVNQTVESVECKDLYRYINLIGFNGRNRSWLKNRVKCLVRPKIKQIKKKLKKQSTIAVHVDQFDRKKINDTWMGDLEAQLKRAKQCSDLLVVLIHIGGQFNVEPGDYSKYMMDRLCELGADIIVGNHPHTAQRVEKRESGAIAAYSLGGYCMSVSGEYLVHDCLPEYSLALHIDIDENAKIACCTADILKGTEDKNLYLAVTKANVEDTEANIIRERCMIRESKDMDVVISADDFGKSSTINRAIHDAMKAGSVRSTALMMGAEYTEEAVKYATGGGYISDVHCHLNLVSTKSLGFYYSPQSDIFAESDFCENGKFKGKAYYNRLYRFDSYKYVDVIFQELESQYLGFKEITDGKANYQHVDFHMYMNLCPPVAAAYSRLIKKHHIQSARFFGEHQRYAKESRKRRLVHRCVMGLGKHNSAYVMKSCKIEHYLEYYDQLAGEKNIELYVHPDYVEGVLLDNTPSALGREKCALEENVELAKKHSDIEIISWSSLNK